MVKTPWFEKAIPFHEAARDPNTQSHPRGTCNDRTGGYDRWDFSELPENFADAEALTINLLKKQNKPFLILVNSQMPYKKEEINARNLSEIYKNKYGVTTMAANCEQLRKKMSQNRSIYCMNFR